MTGLLGETLLVRVHSLLSPLIDHAFRVDHDDVVTLNTQLDVMLGTGNGGGASTVDYDPDLFNPLARQLESVYQGCPRDDGCPVLIIMEYGNVHLFLKGLFDIEALRCLNVLQVDATERWLEQLAGLNDLVRIVRV